MAKALMGHVGGIDPRQAQQSFALRQRIADLEAEVLRLKQENDALGLAYREVVAAVAVDSDDLTLASH